MKPIWLLDIDGVVNCGNRTPPTHLGYNFLEFKQRAGDGYEYNMIVAKEVVDFIDEMSDFFQIVWCTTWQQDANAFGKKIGLKEFPWIDESKLPYSQYHWKRAAFEKFQEAGHSVLWTDDDIRKFYNYPRKVAFDNCLLIWPSTFEGLCPRHLDKIREFRGKLL